MEGKEHRAVTEWECSAAGGVSFPTSSWLAGMRHILFYCWDRLAFKSQRKDEKEKQVRIFKILPDGGDGDFMLNAACVSPGNASLGINGISTDNDNCEHLGQMFIFLMILFPHFLDEILSEVCMPLYFKLKNNYRNQSLLPVCFYRRSTDIQGRKRIKRKAYSAPLKLEIHASFVSYYVFAINFVKILCLYEFKLFLNQSKLFF